jgi:type IV secretion system protein VirD4
MSKVNVILDEAGTLGQMNCIEDALDKFRAFGIRLQLYYQSPAQLKKCFPREQDLTVLSNTTQIYFGVNDNVCAEEISKRLGETTIISESGGSGSSTSHSRSMSGTQDSLSCSSNTNRNWAQMGRKLLKPEEVLTLNERIAITFVPGLPPICTTLQRFYERKWTPRRSLKAITLCRSLCLLIIGTFCLIVTVYLAKELKHGRIIRGPQERRQTFRSSGEHGAGIRTFQRPRVRPLRSRPIYTDP